MRVAELADAGGVERRPRARSLADVTIRSRRENEVDLLVVDEVLLGHGHGHEQRGRGRSRRGS